MSHIGDASASEESDSIKGQVSKSLLGTLDFELENKETHKLTRQYQRAFKQKLTDTGLGGAENNLKKNERKEKKTTSGRSEKAEMTSTGYCPP